MLAQKKRTLSLSLSLSLSISYLRGVRRTRKIPRLFPRLVLGRTSKMRLPVLPVNAQAAVAAALMCCSLTMAPPAFGADAIYGAAGEFTEATKLDGGYRGSVPGQDKQIAAGKGQGAEKLENSKIQGGGASTLQGGRRITITRGVNLDSLSHRAFNPGLAEPR
jgi:hypothetical protein